MAEPHDDPFPESALDDALEQAWGAKKKQGESVVAQLERLSGVRTRVNLQEPLEEDAAPLLRVGAAEGPDRPTEDSRYQLVGEIARGGVGIIYRGRDRDLGRDVALKVLRTEHADKDVVVTRFVEEAQIGAQLQHPGIVPVYSLGLQPDGRPHFAMKLVKGRTLGALLESRRDVGADQRRFLRMFLQCCETVSYAHARDVLHRDLKPANVMVGAFGEVLVVDWGFGKVLGREEHVSKQEPVAKTVIATVRTGSEGSQSLVGSVMGTPAYMPPEQALGHVEELDACSDVFSLGAILCEILTGKPPYLGELRDLLVQAAQTRTEPALERLASCDADEALKSLVRQCLQAVPGDRPANAGVVATAISDWMASADERAERAEVEAVEERARLERERERVAWERRAKRKMRLGAVAAGLAILLGAGALWLVDARRHERAAAARPAVERAFLEAANLQGAGRLADALGAAERARDLAQTGGVTDDMQQRAVALVAEVRTKLQHQQAEAERAGEAQAFVAELADVLLGRWETFNETHTDLEYAAAFGARRLNPLEDEPADVATRIRDRYPDVLEDIAAGLDGWATVRWKREREDLPWERILACARSVDPDPLRSRIRTAMYSRDAEALRALADEQGDVDLPGPTVYLFGTILSVLLDQEGVDRRYDMLQRRLLQHPGDFWTHAYLSFPRDSNDEKEIVRALDHASAAVALRPTLVRAHHNVAMRLRDLRRYEQAHAVISEALRLAPDDASTVCAYGTSASYIEAFDDAEHAWRRAASLDPSLDVPVLNLAWLHHRRDELERAADVYRQGLKLNPRSSAGLSGLALVLGDLGRHGEQLATARKACDLDASNLDAWIALASGLGSTERYPEAVAAARRAVELAPRRAKSRTALANALRRMSRLEEAEHQARLALRIDPEHAWAHAALGQILNASGHYEASITSFKEAHRLRPRLQGIEGALGTTLLNLNRLMEAESYLERYLEAHPTDESRGCLAQLRVMQERLDDAQTLLAQVEESDRDREPFAVTFARAVLCEKRGKTELAEVEFRRSVLRNPHSTVSRFRLARLLRQLHRFDEAIALCREGLALAERWSLHHELGYTLMKVHQLAEADHHYRRALELARGGTDEVTIRGALAHLDLMRGRATEAVSHLERVFELGEEGSALPQHLDQADRLMRQAQQHTRLSRVLPAILAGERDPDGQQEWLDAWSLCWALDDRAGARALHERAMPHTPYPTGWLAQQAWECIRNCVCTGLRHPIGRDERLALRGEARELLQRVVEAIREGVDDEQQAREWLHLLRDEPATRSVRDTDALAEMAEVDRIAWTALWKDVDEVLGDDAAVSEGR